MLRFRELLILFCPQEYPQEYIQKTILPLSIPVIKWLLTAPPKRPRDDVVYGASVGKDHTCASHREATFRQYNIFI